MVILLTVNEIFNGNYALETACTGAASVLAVHVCDSVMHSFAALAYGKRRRHHTSAGRQKSMLSETEVGVAVGYNVERPV